MLNQSTLHPFGINSSRVATWHLEPGTRGTYGILCSCLATMALCIWTAVHLNLPEHRGSTKQFFRKFGWLVVGLFAPELVAWTAFQQNRDARYLTKWMRKTLGEHSKPKTKALRTIFGSTDTLFSRDDSEQESHMGESDLLQSGQISSSKESNKPLKRKHAWTIVHSHYALMGGFAIEARDVSNIAIPGNPARLTITSAGLILIAANFPMLLPDISREHIKDKSKANGLAKTLVCLQATWFCAQCISRVARELPICLLELNTFAHAICALVIYILWWYKPLDVVEPTIIQGDHLSELCAMMIMLDITQKTPIFSYKWREPGKVLVAGEEILCKIDFDGTDAVPEDCQLSYPGKYAFKITTNSLCLYSPSTFRQQKEINDSESSAGFTSGSTVLKDGQSVYGFRYTVTKSKRHTPLLELNALDLSCWRLAQVGFKRHGMTEVLGKMQNGPISKSNSSNSLYCLSRRAGEWPSLGEIDSDGLHIRSKSLLAGFTLAGLVYGAIHLFAWSAPFGSEAECIVWRISGITLVVSGFILWCTAYVDLADYFWLACCAVQVNFLLFVFFVMARLYLVIECFINLAYLPNAAFEVPQWTVYFLHVS